MADPTTVNDGSYFDQALKAVVALGAAIGAYVGLSRRRGSASSHDPEAIVQRELANFEERFYRERAHESRQHREQFRQLEDRIERLEDG